jgi:carboxyl-terminal processing protease
MIRVFCPLRRGFLTVSIFRMLRNLVAAFFVLMPGISLGAPEASSSPGMHSYAELQAVRSSIGPAIYGNEAVPPETLRSILDEIDSGLARFATPLMQDLSWGNLPLAGQRVNLLFDKLHVQSRLGDRTGVERTWRELEHHFWLPPEAAALGDETLGLWLSSLPAPDLRGGQAASHLGSYPAAVLAPHRLSREERILGLTTIWSAARNYFVWFDHVPDLDWDSAYLTSLSRVIASPNDDAYWRELMRFTAQLKDGHSNADPPEHLATRFWSRPGLRTAQIGGRVVVVDVTDRGLRGRVHVGDELRDIDNIPVKAYAEARVAPFQSSSTPQDLSVRTYDYALLAGDAAKPVRLRLRRENGRQYVVTAARAGWEVDHEQPDESFERRQDGVAVLTARQFQDDAAGKLLAANFDDVLTAKGLVLDLRGNGGGSSQHGLELLRWLTKSPLPSTNSRVRVQDSMLIGKPAVAWRLIADTMADPASRTYDGPVAMLVDAKTFSAAEDAVATFRLMKRGPIVGVPTGGSTGQPIVLSLPGGGTVRICAKRDEYPDGTSFVGSGIVPDYVVPIALADVRSGADPVLARAVAWVLGSVQSAQWRVERSRMPK